MRYLDWVLIIVFFALMSLNGQSLPVLDPQELGFDSNRLKSVDKVIEQAITEKTIPGATLLISRYDKIAYRKAYGHRQLFPSEKKMTGETIFDLASMTKPIATATSAMILIDRGQLRLLDPVSMYIPDFKPWQDDSTSQKKAIRIIHLMTHTSGLPAYAPVKKLQKMYGSNAPDSTIAHISRVRRSPAPGTFLRYSCLNFITLQQVIEIISGMKLDEFSRQNIFEPLGMNHTTYKPGKNLIGLCAPTEMQEDNKALLGTVHDPLARVMMGCVSGNAGLFSNIDDLSLFSAMMLNEGAFNGTRILSRAATAKMTSVPNNYEQFGRGLGWDIYSDWSSNQGDLFSKKAYGHTGYTGTSIVIDPTTKTVIILLTNRVHPKDEGSVVRLRSLVANIVAGSIVSDFKK